MDFYRANFLKAPALLKLKRGLEARINEALCVHEFDDANRGNTN